MTQCLWLIGQNQIIKIQTNDYDIIIPDDTKLAFSVPFQIFLLLLLPPGSNKKRFMTAIWDAISRYLMSQHLNVTAFITIVTRFAILSCKWFGYAVHNFQIVRYVRGIHSRCAVWKPDFVNCSKRLNWFGVATSSSDMDITSMEFTKTSELFWRMKVIDNSSDVMLIAYSIWIFFFLSFFFFFTKKGKNPIRKLQNKTWRWEKHKKGGLNCVFKNVSFSWK